MPCINYAKFPDGTTKGDGTPETGGMCQQQDATRKCLSTGECRLCKFVTEDLDGTTVNRYEGCGGITSAAPICDADADTTIIEFDNSDYDDSNKIPTCRVCKKKGTDRFAIHLRYAECHYIKISLISVHKMLT